MGTLENSTPSPVQQSVPGQFSEDTQSNNGHVTAITPFTNKSGHIAGGKERPVPSTR